MRFLQTNKQKAATFKIYKTVHTITQTTNVDGFHLKIIIFALQKSQKLVENKENTICGYSQFAMVLIQI